MQGVVRGGGTATGAQAAGHQLAGKTGTVNDHTDVWFIGYTPTYVTGVWMGNPLRKESLGSNMTGGHGAVPFFNGFMIPFMKDKPREKFYETPQMPADIKALNEQRLRDELEKLEKAEEAGRNLGIVFDAGPKVRRSSTKTETTNSGEETTATGLTNPNTTTTDNEEPPPPPSVNKPVETNKPPKPAETPAKKPETPKEDSLQNEGAKRKGKKGDDEP